MQNFGKDSATEELRMIQEEEFTHLEKMTAV
jgi:hypothetical protein